ncbi:hypothetical protein ACHAWO_004162 [Cyclotella atomus]|uniref:Phosphoinositide phospholipase C n=1 Tax=Cyclotella atomus TaxID=382360 RepID=A0ABD3N7S6_9STRA
MFSKFRSGAGQASNSPSHPPSPSRQITFKSALERIRVDEQFFTGINVFKVNQNGKLEPALFTLSQDRFIISVLPRKLEPSNLNRTGSGGILRPSIILSRIISTSSTGGDSLDGAGSIDTAILAAATVSTDTVNVGSIDRIQAGQNTLKFELARQREKKLGLSRSINGIPLLNEDKCFSLIFRGAKTLDLMVDECGNREEILYVLTTIVKEYERAKLKVGNEVQLLRYIWNDVDRDNSNTINEKEMGELLNRINFQIKEKNHSAVYQKFAKTLGLDKATRKRGLTFEQCVILLHKTKRDTWQVKPVTQLFYDMFGQFMNNNKVRKKVSATSFLNRFLITVQGEEDKTMEDVKKIFASLHEMELAHVNNHVDEKDYISSDHFEAYLHSRSNDLFDPQREKYRQDDMTRPLSEYWINSSHNTYLTGDQLTSRSSVEMYTKALYRGCRCLELDIWDGGRDDFGNAIPIVYHGHTMTTKILFEDIIKALQMFLVLHPDSYPLILSLENHCSLPFQEAMAAQLKSILGKKLYIPDEQSLLGRLPSPQELRGMVVLKGRRPVGATDDYDTDDDAANDDMTDQQSVVTATTVKTSMTSLSSSRRVSTSVKIAPELAKLTLFHGTKFRSWDESIETPTYHMHSFSESRVRTFSKSSNAYKWIEYNQTHLSRAFPSGKRVDSSNYSPILAWSTGCQMVALNYQTPDEPLRINDGRFRENGEQGYVLKPSTLMMKGRVDPCALLMEVKILSGSCLPKPGGLSSGDCIDPYVIVSLFDCHEGREITSSQNTNVVMNNGFSPIWNFEDSYHFTVQNTDVAILHFAVWDKNSSPKSDEFIASASIPISCMRQGIRSVQLFDSNNTRSGAFDFASLLVLVRFEYSQAEL